MSENLLFRNSKAILKVRENPDGTLTLMKHPPTVKPDHIMRITGSPGWDKRYVDQVFVEGTTGTLSYQYGGARYEIPIEDFRAHAFEKEMPGHDQQYHIDVKHYKSYGIVSPLRGEAEPRRDTAAPIPSRFAFGEYVPCVACKGVAYKSPCKTCQGAGFVRWGT